jgi:presequence protease
MENFIEGGIYHGFILKRSVFDKDMDSWIMSFTHEKSCAKLTAIKNADDNKTFCIAFRTIPEDSTGVAHILEHCVLSGSEKFPVKDVFSELNKGGLSTFMNALTSADSTFYPFSTRNLKEYFNFMNVYLDTTLFPLLEKNTFMQEGWHYNKPEDEMQLEYQGIVLNEMKGAMSNPLRQMSMHISKVLFPESTYSHNSGGDPEAITELTYEYFKEFHKKHYHPSNSLIYIYGNADLNEELRFINENYLFRFDNKSVRPEIKNGKYAAPMTTETFSYPISATEDKSKKTFIAIATRTGAPADAQLNLTLNLLTNILLNSDASPLRQAVMKSEIAGDFSGYFDDGQYEGAVLAYISGSEEAHCEKFIDIYRSTLRELAEKGISKELILSEINHLEFKQKEKEISAMRGIIYLYRVIHLEFYGIDLFSGLNLNPVLQSVRKKVLEGSYLEEIITNLLLDEKKTAVVILKPDHNEGQERFKKEKEKLESFESSLTAEQKNELFRKIGEFRKYQDKENSDEDLEKIPKLEIKDIDRRPLFLIPDAEKIDGIEYLSNEMYTNDIIYISFGFDLGRIPADLLPYLNLLTDLFKETGTKSRPYDVLFREISTYFGGFDFSLSMIDDVKDQSSYRPVLYLEIRTFKKFLSKVVEIIRDILTNIIFTDKERLKEIISSRHLARELNLKSEGYNYSITRLKAGVNERGKFLEAVKGLTSYYVYKTLHDEFDSVLDDYIVKVKKLFSLVFNRQALHIGITSDQEGIRLAKSSCRDIVSSLSDIKLQKGRIIYPETPQNEAFIIQSDVNFVSLGGNFLKEGVKYSGNLEVVKNYLSSDYLFDTVRLKGGAYGSWIYFNNISGFLSITSYRDPNVGKTLEIYHKIPEHLKNFSMDPSSFTNIKIGAYAAFDPLLSPYLKGKKSKEDYMTGITREFVEKTACDILSTTQKDIRETADLFAGFLNDSVITAMGNEEKLKKDKDIFSAVIELK